MKQNIPKTLLLAGGLFLLFLLSGCSLFLQDSTWTFENSANGVDYIIVTPEGSADDTPFTLRYGDTHTVTWEGSGKDYRGGYSWDTHWSRSGVSGASPKQYDSLKEIVFYTDWK